MWGSNPERGKRLFSESCRPAVGPTHSPIHWVPGLFPGGQDAAASNLPLSYVVQRLRMSGAIPLLHIYAFMAYTWTPFALYPRVITSKLVVFLTNLNESLRVRCQLFISGSV